MGRKKKYQDFTIIKITYVGTETIDFPITSSDSFIENTYKANIYDIAKKYNYDPRTIFINDGNYYYINILACGHYTYSNDYARETYGITYGNFRSSATSLENAQTLADYYFDGMYANQAKKINLCYSTSDTGKVHCFRYKKPPIEIEVDEKWMKKFLDIKDVYMDMINGGRGTKIYTREQQVEIFDVRIFVKTIPSISTEEEIIFKMASEYYVDEPQVSLDMNNRTIVINTDPGALLKKVGEFDLGGNSAFLNLASLVQEKTNSIEEAKRKLLDGFDPLNLLVVQTYDLLKKESDLSPRLETLDTIIHSKYTYKCTVEYVSEISFCNMKENEVVYVQGENVYFVYANRNYYKADDYIVAKLEADDPVSLSDINLGNIRKIDINNPSNNWEEEVDEYIMELQQTPMEGIMKVSV